MNERIRQALKLSGMRQADLARELKITPAAVSLWFSKTSGTTPSEENLMAVAAVTGVPLPWLRGEWEDLPEYLPTRVRRNWRQGIRDDLLELMTKAGHGDKRSAVDATVSVSGVDMRFLYVDRDTVIDVALPAPSEVRAVLWRLSVLRHHDERARVVRRYLVVTLGPSGLEDEGKLLGIEIRTGGAGEILAEAIRGTPYGLTEKSV